MCWLKCPENHTAVSRFQLPPVIGAAVLKVDCRKGQHPPLSPGAQAPSSQAEIAQQWENEPSSRGERPGAGSPLLCS